LRIMTLKANKRNSSTNIWGKTNENDWFWQVGDALKNPSFHGLFYYLNHPGARWLVDQLHIQSPQSMASGSGRASAALHPWRSRYTKDQTWSDGLYGLYWDDP
jgi:hypothetical protein